MRIRSLRLETANISQLQDFYTEILGIPLIRSSATAFTLKVGRTHLTFEQGNAHRYHLAFNIPHNQFDSGKTWLASRLPLVDVMGKDHIHFKAWNAHSLYFYDLAGNILELIARHDLDNTSDAHFSGESLLSVSEIGLTTNNVRQFAEQITKTCGFPYYDGEGSNDFSAIGDPDGLLIIVPEKRVWFPETGIPATYCPLTVTFESNQKLTYDADSGYTIDTDG